MCKPQGDKEWLRCEKVWTEKRLTFGAVQFMAALEKGGSYGTLRT